MAMPRAELKHRDIIEQMTLDEKASLTSGADFWHTKTVERLGIPAIMLTDGPHGVRKQGGKADNLGLNKSIPATCFPTAATAANSWDVALQRRVGKALGREAAAEKVSVVLGPGLNIVRDPLAGRAFEFFSEDPYISGELAAAMIEGIQSEGVAACAKHFAVNSQEHLRMTINEVVDERTLRELYLEAFRRVVTKAKPRVVMSSYNKVNGTYTNENEHLLADILRKEWGYKGVVVTDWGGNNNRVAGLKVGNQLEMPSSGGVTDAEVVAAVKTGELDECLLDERIDTLLDLIFTTYDAIHDATAADYEAHHMLAAEAARQSMVLLKNNDNALPLGTSEKIAVIGDYAKTPRYQGAGSSLVVPTRLDIPLDALQKTKCTIVGYEPGFKRAGGRSAGELRRALRLAQSADTVLLFLGVPEASEAEGIDREHMRLPDNQLELVNEVIKLGKKVVVVLAGGAPVELPFADDVDAILHSFFGGQAMATALADILTGKVSPSGKLAMSYPYKYKDTPTAGNYPGNELTAEHREALFVGYRYYDTQNMTVRYPFGYGLSYTTFEYSNLKVSKKGVSCHVTNTGIIKGSEIVQVYVGMLSASYHAPRHELRGFAKIFLDPGETKEVTIEFDEHTFAHFSASKNHWVVEEGERLIEVGASSRDIRLSGTLQVSGEAPEKRRKDLSLYYKGDVKKVKREEFTALLGHEPPRSKWNKKAPLTMDDAVRQLEYQNWLGRAVFGLVKLVRQYFFWVGNPKNANYVMLIIDLPFNKMERMSGGRLPQRYVERFIRLASRKAK